MDDDGGIGAKTRDGTNQTHHIAACWVRTALRMGAAIWWLDTPQLIAAATAEQEARYQGDAWDARIGRWLTHERRRVNRGFGAFEDWREEEVERAQPIRDVGAPPIARSLSADRGSIRADEAA